MGAPDYLRFLIALAFVLALMALLAYVLRRLNLGGVANPLANRRLNVLETRPLDHRHKLVLVKCDDREHLLLLGPQGETVIDSNIPHRDSP